MWQRGIASLTRTDGVRPGDFLLADVFGASHQGQTEADYTFIAPTDPGRDLLDGFNDKYPMSISGAQMIVEAHEDTEVLGTTILPYTTRSDGERFASIHCDPPGIPTGSPAIVRNRYGNGLCLYVTGDVERRRRHGATFAGLIRSLLTRPLAFESDAPKAVEITALHQPDRKRFIVNALNFQEELPNIPVEGFTIRLHLGGRQVRRVLHLPAETELPHTRDGEWVVLTAPRIETLGMFAVEYD